ncbi:methionyl-tRNA formyltransferase [Thermodesulfobacteriota bacterium]
MTLKIVFMGTPEFAVPTLKALSASFNVVGVLTQPDRPRGRGRKVFPSPVKAAALELGLPVANPAKVSSEEGLTAIKRWSPDVIVVAAYGGILPRRVLEMPPLGCVNLHSSLLPRHRGASPISSAILAGDKVTGLTTMFMDEGMDTGPILMQEELEIGDDETTKSLHDRMLEPGASLVVRTLELLSQEKIEPRTQNEELATYTEMISKEDGRLGWQNPAEYIDRQVRAMIPWPVAFYENSGQVLKIWKATPVEGTAEPGRIVVIDREGITVGTGRGLLRLEEVQASGKKRMPASEFARGRRLRAGDAL